MNSKALWPVGSQDPAPSPPSLLPPPTKLPWKEPCLWDQKRRPECRHCYSVALGTKASQATCLCLLFPIHKMGSKPLPLTRTADQYDLSIHTVLGSGGIPENVRESLCLRVSGGWRGGVGGRTTPQHRQEVVSPMREVQILCSGICLQQGVALPAGGVRWTSRTSGLAQLGRVGFQLIKMGEAAPDRANALRKWDSGTIPSRRRQRRGCLYPAFIPSLSTLSPLALTFQLSWIFPSFLKNFLLAQLSPIVDAFLEF